MEEKDLIDFNLSLRLWAEKWTKWSPWHPVDGALLLSGLNPGMRWDALKAHDWGCIDHRAVSKLVDEAAGSAHPPISEFAGAPMFKSESHRRRLADVGTILAVWNDYCEGCLSEGATAPTRLMHFEFVGWWWEYGDDSPLRDSTYFDAFVELCNLLPKKNNHIPLELARQAASRGAQARHGDTRKKHDLFREIEKAQEDARRGRIDPYSAKDVFPLLAELLRTGQSRNATLVDYVAKKSLTYKKDGEDRTMRFDSFDRHLRDRRAHDRTI